MPKFDEEDDELISLIKQYEKYVISKHGEVEDFDEWLESVYGNSRSKVMKPSKKGKGSMKSGNIEYSWGAPANCS